MTTNNKPSTSSPTAAHRRAAFALLVVARDFDEAADRAFTIAAVDQREHEADQTRILAGALASGEVDPSVDDAWLYSCRRILERHDRADSVLEARSFERAGNVLDRVGKVEDSNGELPRRLRVASDDEGTVLHGPSSFGACQCYRADCEMSW